MERRLLALVAAFGIAIASATAQAAPAVEELPIPGLSAHGTGKLHRDDSSELRGFPEPNEVTEPQASASGPRAVFRNGCIFRPFARASFSLSARGVVLYRVVPSRFFDVTMRVTYVGLRSFFVDRFFDGGAEAIRIRGPFAPRLVRVTIGGFRGDTGCWAFSATP